MCFTITLSIMNSNQNIQKTETAENRIQLRDMRSDDLDAILAIEFKSFPQAWPRTTFEACLAQKPFTQSWVAIQDQHIVGYLIASYIPRYAKEEGEIHISNIAVSPSARRENIGTMLLRQALEYGDTHLCDLVCLEVRESNNDARAFYKRFGFINVGRRPNYYENEDAILMEAAVQNALHLMQEGEI